MTNEEAISIMKVVVHMLEPQYDTDRVEDAVEMAIKALTELDNYQKARNEINQEIINWNDIDNGKVRGLFLAESIMANYVDGGDEE